MSGITHILKSASKIVFILLTLAACIGFFLGILEPKDFMLLAISAYSFYYSSKGDAQVSSQRVVTEEGKSSVETVNTAPPFAGK